jgi:hypothetical protein
MSSDRQRAQIRAGKTSRVSDNARVALPAWPVETRYQAILDGVTAGSEHNWNRLGCCFGGRNAVIHNGIVDAGVSFLAKPFTLDALAAKIRRVLEADPVKSDPSIARGSQT